MSKRDASTQGIGGMWYHAAQHERLGGKDLLSRFWPRWLDLRFSAPLEHVYIRHNRVQAVSGVRIALIAVLVIVSLSMGLDVLFGGSLYAAWRIRMFCLLVTMGWLFLSYAPFFTRVLSLMVWTLSAVITTTFLSLSVSSEYEVAYFYGVGLAPILLCVTVLGQVTILSVLLLCGAAFVFANTYWALYLADGLAVRWLLWDLLYLLIVASTLLSVSQWEQWRRRQFLNLQHLERTKFSALKDEHTSDKLTFLVSLDAELGVANRRSFERALRQEWRRASRNQQPIALLLIEVKHKKLSCEALKREGRRPVVSVLTEASEKRRRLTQRLTDVCRMVAGIVRRPGDLVARYSEDCVAVMLIDTQRQHAMMLSKKLRHRLLEQWQKKFKGAATPCSVSIGLSTVLPSSVVFPADLIRQAESALRQARQNEAGLSDHS